MSFYRDYILDWITDNQFVGNEPQTDRDIQHWLNRTPPSCPVCGEEVLTAEGVILIHAPHANQWFIGLAHRDQKECMSAALNTPAADPRYRDLRLREAIYPSPLIRISGGGPNIPILLSFEWEDPNDDSLWGHTAQSIDAHA